MGFLKNLELSNDVIVEQAYLKIALYGDSTEMDIIMTSYKNRDSMLMGIPSISTERDKFTPDLTNDVNLFDQAYNHVKTKEEYSDVVDVFEEVQIEKAQF